MDWLAGETCETFAKFFESKGDVNWRFEPGNALRPLQGGTLSPVIMLEHNQSYTTIEIEDVSGRLIIALEG